MSYRQYFSEVEAVAQVLEEWVKEQDSVVEGDEVFTAVWQAVELLSRAYAVLMPLLQLDLAKQDLNLPDVTVSDG